MSTITKAEKSLAEALADFDQIQASQSAKVTAAKSAFDSSPNEQTATDLANAERVADLLTGAAQKRVDDAKGEVARLEHDAKLARLQELETQWSSKGHQEFLMTLVPAIAEARKALVQIGEKILTDASERTTALIEWEGLASELGFDDNGMRVVQGRHALRSALDAANRLSDDAVANPSRERFVVSGGNRQHAMITANELAIRWAFGERT
jgi:hypothetical protein